VTRLVALVALLTLPVGAVQLHVEVDPGAPITQRVLFVVDRSGSMHGDHFTRALVAVRGLIEHPTDDLEVAVIAFNDTAVRWPGKPESGPREVPQGWAALPSDTAVGEAEAWLEELGAGGDTLVIPALRAALSEARSGMSVVLVTDGLFGRERTDEVLQTIAGLQAEREKAGHGRAVIGVYGLGGCQKVLMQIGEAGGGGYVREEVPLEDEEDLGTLRGVRPPPR
jgi:Mg-chelatase subunit ChlD